MNTNPTAQLEMVSSSQKTSTQSSKYLKYEPDGIPQVIRQHPHWLVCNNAGEPVRRDNVGDSKTNPAHWTDFATASRIATNEAEVWPYIVLTVDTAFTVFDVDFKSRREEESKEDYTARIIRANMALDRLREIFPIRYESKSKSGKGFHIIVKGKFDGTGGKGKGEWADIEIYTRKHGIALTGHVLEGHDNPVEYPAETIQGIRDVVKASLPTVERNEDSSEHCRNGNVSPEFARQVLEELASLHGRPDYPVWRDISSAFFDGVGVETGIELLEEYWPEEKEGEYQKLAKSLQKFIPWGTLRSYGVNPGDPEELHFLMPDMSAERLSGELPTIEAFPIIRAGLTDGISDTADFVENLLTDGGASVVYGPSNCGKSFWILDLAVSVATGNPFRGNMEVDQGAVIYVALEGSRGAKNRIEAMKREGSMPDDAPLFMCYAPVSLLEKGHSAKLEASIKIASEESSLPCRLVILDTLARTMAGGDENSGKDMGAAVKVMDKIREDTGAHVCLIHHCGKDEARGARGHSSLRAAIDTEIEITRPEGSGISTVRATKQRDLQAGDAMPFSLKVITLGMNRRGKPITSCVVQHENKELASKPGKAGRKAKCTADEMLRYLPAASVKEWKERVNEETGLAGTQFYEHKKTLEKEGKVHRQSGTGRILCGDQKTVSLY